MAAVGDTALWIPESARPEPVIVLRCNVCLREFPTGQRAQWRRHCIACARKNEDVEGAGLEEYRKSAFRQQADPELYAHLRKPGAKKPKKPLIAV